MSIEAISKKPHVVSFGAEGAAPEKKEATATVKTPTMAVPGAVTGALAGGATGYFMKTAINADNLAGLADDKFESTFKPAKEKNEKIVESLGKQRKAIAGAEKAGEDFANGLKGEDGKISIEGENFKKLTGYDSAEALNKAHTEESGKTEGLKTALKDAKEEAAKTTAQANLDANEKLVKELSAKKTLVEGAKENKVEVAAVKEFKKSAIVAEAKKGITEGLKTLGENVPKINSLKKAGLYAAIGAVALGIVGSFIGGKKVEAPAAPAAEAPAAEAKPEEKKA